jgi:hypothetical protein
VGRSAEAFMRRELASIRLLLINPEIPNLLQFQPELLMFLDLVFLDTERFLLHVQVMIPA